MKKILVIGAGRSAVTLIKYLLDNAEVNNWSVTVADFSEELAKQAVNNHPNAKAIFFNVTDVVQRENEITLADIVISMLPPAMHIMVAEDCVRLGKNLVTASYVSKEILALDEKAKKAGVLLLNEIGLDPGIDHMSAMQIIDKIKENGGELTSFKSFCGGLVHPDYDNNPWNYKFTWNPRNVVLAGQGTAQYIKQGKYKYIPYHKLFERTETMRILDAGCGGGDAADFAEMLKLDPKPYYRNGHMAPQIRIEKDPYIPLTEKDVEKAQYFDKYLQVNWESIETPKPWTKAGCKYITGYDSKTNRIVFLHHDKYGKLLNLKWHNMGI